MEFSQRKSFGTQPQEIYLAKYISCMSQITTTVTILFWAS